MAGSILDQLCRRSSPRHASLRLLRHEGELLDEALVLWFPAPASYTGEDCVELHVHGGPAVISGIGDALTNLGARPAEPGEFTRRAFSHGRMDLTAAEGVADLIEAETAAQRRQALRQAGGALARRQAQWVDRLTRILARQEAFIEFEDEDLPSGLDASIELDARQLREELGQELQEGRRGETLRQGVRIAIIGAPNGGKSSLLNALCGREVAIVSPQPGTTRDVIEARVIMAGVPVTLVDTAGLRDTPDFVESEGVRRARVQGHEADIVLIVIAVDAGPDVEARAWIETGGLRVNSKRDLARSHVDGLAVSTLTGEGMAELRQALEFRVAQLASPTDAAGLTRPRHRAALVDAVRALELMPAAVLPELRAEALRAALRALGRLTGAVGIEAILDMVFSEFCIGK